MSYNDDRIRSECILHFNLVKKHCPYIDLSEIELNRIRNFAKFAAMSGAVEERQHKDSDGFEQRFMIGFIGEYAISKYLGYRYLFKGSYPGGSFANNFADLSYLGYGVGIKSSRVGRSVKIGFKEEQVQLICQYEELSNVTLDGYKRYIRVYFMGFLKPEYINQYCLWDNVEEGNLKSKGTKGGFYNFEKLIPFTIERLKGYAFNVDVKNYLYNNYNSNILGIVEDNCIYMEKEKGYELAIIPKPSIEGSAFKYYTVTTDFSRENVERQDEILNILSQRVVIGYGIAGYLHMLQNAYNGSNKYDIMYIDLDDIIRMYNLEDSAKLNSTWVNRLYAWRDYFKKYVSVERKSNEYHYDYHFRIVMAFLKVALEYLNRRKGVA